MCLLCAAKKRAHKPNSGPRVGKAHFRRGTARSRCGTRSLATNLDERHRKCVHGMHAEMRLRRCGCTHRTLAAHLRKILGLDCHVGCSADTVYQLHSVCGADCAVCGFTRRPHTRVQVSAEQFAQLALAGRSHRCRRALDNRHGGSIQVAIVKTVFVLLQGCSFVLFYSPFFGVVLGLALGDGADGSKKFCAKERLA